MADVDQHHTPLQCMDLCLNSQNEHFSVKKKAFRTINNCSVFTRQNE